MMYEEALRIEPKSRNRLRTPGVALAILAAALMLAILTTSCGGDQPTAGQPPAGGGSSGAGQPRGESSGGTTPAPEAKTGIATAPKAQPPVAPSPTADPRLAAWKYESPIAKPLSASIGNAPSSVGDVEKDLVRISIPGNILDSTATVTVASPDKVPDIIAKEFAPGGPPIQITAGDKEVRLNEPVSVTMKIDSSLIASNTRPSDFWVTYHNGKDWEYLAPTAVDLKARTLTFATYHFSLFGYGKISLEKRIEKYAHSKTLENMAQKTVDKYVDKAVEKAVQHILKDRLGIDDESAKSKILSSLANDDDYRDIYEKIQEGDVVGANQTIIVLAGKKIAENVDESKLSKALGSLADKGVGYVEAVSQASGYLAEGRYKDAGRIMAEKIADQFLVAKGTKVAIEAIDYQIGQWKNSEIEAAYQAFKNGASGKFWGYNVDKGDFESLWNQMRGISRQLQIEEINRVNRERADTEPPQDPLSPAEEDKIRAGVENDLKAKFQERVKNEAQVEKETKDLDRLINEFKDKSLLDPGMFGYKSELDVEQRLDLLLNLKNRIQRDTGRTLNLDLKVSSDKQLALVDLIAVTYKWYEGPDAYASYLKEKFGIDPYPTPQEVSGKWNTGAIVLTEIYVDPEALKAAAPSQAEINYYQIAVSILDKQKGKPLPINIDMQVGKDGAGTMSFGEPGKLSSVGQMKYSKGSISVGDIKPAPGTMEGVITRNPRGLELRGTLKVAVTIADKEIGWSKGTWTATKDMATAGSPAPAKNP